MWEKIYNYFVKVCNEEKENFILWIPIFFGFGIFVKYNFNVYCFFKYLYIFLLSLFIFLSIKRKKINYCLIYLLFLAFGYVLGYLSIKANDLPIINEKLGLCTVYGTVYSEQKVLVGEQYKTEIIVNVDKIFIQDKNEFLDKSQTPKKLKIRLDEYIENVNFSKSEIEAVLFPIGEQKLFSSFNTRQYNYFKNIGGVGYKGVIIKNPQNIRITIKQKIDRFRYNFANKIISDRNSISSGIIATLLTGQKNLANKNAVEYMNFAGLSHLLAISGIHMMTLIGFVFCITKWILLHFEGFALKYNVYKISAGFSLIFNFLYLMLSGFSVSAVRAYIMSSLLLLSMIVNRFNDSKRTVMFVMFIMLLISPQSVLSVGFQLSFISVISIISSVQHYNEARRNRERTLFSNTKLYRFLDYTWLSFIISLTAEGATTPISIFYFNNYTFYNVFTNVVAEPLITFFGLPLSIIATLFYFVKLDKIFVVLATYSVDIVLIMSEYVTKIPTAVMFIRSPNIYVMFLTILGILWLSLWKTKIRRIGYIFYIIGAVIFCFQKVPDVIIDKTEQSIYFKGNTGKVYAYQPSISSGRSIAQKMERGNYINITRQYKYKNYLYFYKKNKEIKIDLNNFDFYTIDNIKTRRENSLILLYL